MEEIEAIGEDLGVDFVELVFHQIEVGDGESKELAVFGGEDGELPFEEAASLDPAIQIKSQFVLLQETHDNARDAKVVPLGYVQVVLILVPRQHVPSPPTLEKVNTINVVVIVENELIFLFYQGLQQRAYPRNETLWPVFQEIKLTECPFKNVIRRFDLQVIGKILNELDKLLGIARLLNLHRLLNLFIKLQGQAALPIKCVQLVHFLLHNCIFLVVVL